MKIAISIVISFLLSVDARSEDPPDWGPDVSNLGAPINTEASEYNPELSPDELSLIFSSRREGGHGSNDLWIATRPALDAPWDAPRNLGAPINSPAWETGATLTGDWLELYFTSTRGEGEDRDLYVTTRTSIDAPISEPRRLDPPINTDATDSGAYVSEDGLTLVFSSTRPGGYGDRDLYIATRASRDEPWSEVTNLGEAVNSVHDDSSPTMTSDKRVLFFHTRRREGSEKHDIYVTRRRDETAPWSAAVGLEKINTSEYHEGTPTLSADADVLLFRSERPGGVGNQDIWQVLNPLEGIEWPD